MKDNPTVEVPIVWFEALIRHAADLKPGPLDHNLVYLLGYIESAKSIISPF